MEKIRKINTSNKSIIVFTAFLFAFMLMLNFLTPYVADDYVYRYSFYGDKEPITGISQIYSSMVSHSKHMNGRVISHGLEQFFMLFSKTVFNFLNAVVFTGFIYMIYRLAMKKKEHNLAVCGIVFAAFWYFCPAFGQVCLWQVGALNYLWAAFFVLIFLYPYIEMFKTGTDKPMSVLLTIAFCVFSFIFGMYSEIASFIAIGTAATLVILSLAVNKTKPSIGKLLPIVLAVIGFVVLLKMPAEISAKTADGITVSLLAKNFIVCGDMLIKHMTVPAIIWVCIFILSCYSKINKTSIILSAVFFLWGIASNYMMLIAPYYPERCMYITVAFLIIASVIPVGELLKTKHQIFLSGIALAVCYLFAITAVSGSADILGCYIEFRAREAYIYEMKSQGYTDLEVKLIYPNGKYSAFYDLRYLASDTSETWPNMSMSRYYGVDSIIGIE